MHRMSVCLLVLLLAALSPVLPACGAERGGLVLSFDDGDRSWVTAAAPELARVGGVATAFPTNRNVRGGMIGFADLRELQDRYGWEIGTHTTNHYNAQLFIEKKGIEVWGREELAASIHEFAKEGLRIRSLAFPFNVATPRARSEALKQVSAVRVFEPLPVFSTFRDGHILPSTTVDFSCHTPLALIKKWIDLAREQGAFLSLYAHRVLPDEQFHVGTVETLEAHVVVAREPVPEHLEGPLFIIPDMERRYLGEPIPVERIEGRVIHTGRGDMTRLASAGCRFMMGPGYSMRLSDFRELVEYASGRLTFYTVQQALRKASEKQPE